jgi:hypothetical protein
VTQRIYTDTLSKVGIGTAANWRAAGLSQGQLKLLIQAGELVKIRYGVYAKASVVSEAGNDPRLRHAVQVAAVTTRIREGVASHQSAALMHGLGLLTKPADGIVTLTEPPGKRSGPYGRASVIRHTAELPDQHVTRLFGMRVTAIARTVTDIARTSPFMEAVVVADSALHERHTSKTELRRVLGSCDRWPGIKHARDVVDFSSALAESVLESCARVFFRDHGLPPPTLQAAIIGRSGYFIARTDFCWAQYQTIAEADGLLKYNGREDAIAELKRDRLLRHEGYEVVHFTWQELFSDPAGVAARIRAAFDRSIRLAR